MKKGFSKDGYKSNSKDKNNPVNIIPSGRITMQDVPHPVLGIDNMGNQIMMLPGREYNFPGEYVTEYPIKQIGGSIFPYQKDIGNLLKKTAQKMAKQFGSVKAPQNVATDEMINYKKNMFTNKMAQNAFMAMAAEEANLLTDQLTIPRPMMQYGGSNTYHPNFSNAGAYFDAYNTMKNQSSADFNNFIGASGQLAGSIYMNPGELKLKKLRTRLTDPLVQDQYQDYSDIIMPPNQNMDPSLMTQQPMMQYGGNPNMQIDPQGGIGQAMYSSGFYDTYPQDGSQQWVTYPGTNIPVNPSQAYIQDNSNGQGYVQNQSFAAGQDRRRASNTVRRGSENSPAGNIREFSHEDVTNAQNNNPQQRRGNYEDPSSTTNQVTNRGQVFVTQPGAQPGYNLFPTNRRWQRNGMVPTGPAIAYNPADTYLDEYNYKGRLFGQGPRKVTMRFSHYGQPGFAQTNQNVISNPDQGLTQGQAPSMIGQQYIPSVQNTHPVYDSNNSPYYGIGQEPSFDNSTHGQMDFMQNLNQQLPFNAETARALGNVQFAEGGPIEEGRINPYYAQQMQLYNESKKPFGMPVDKVLEGDELENWLKEVGMAPSQVHQSQNLFVGGYKPIKVLYNTKSNNFHPLYNEPMKELAMPSTTPSSTSSSTTPKAPRSGYYKGNLNYIANPNATASFNIPYTSDEERMRIEADFKNIKTDKDYKNSPYYQRYGENAYKAGISYVPEPLATLQHGGSAFPTQPFYPGATPFHSYTAFFQDGGTMQPGFPNAGQPWAQTEAVWKRSAAGAGQDWADWGLAGMSMISSFGEQNERKALEEQMKQRMLGDAVFQPNGAGDASRGTWTTNSGAFRPDQMTPVQFQGWNQGMIGSPMTQYQQGGEYYLSDDEIDEIMRMGGNVEYLD